MALNALIFRINGKTHKVIHLFDEFSNVFSNYKTIIRRDKLFVTIIEITFEWLFICVFITNVFFEMRFSDKTFMTSVIKITFKLFYI